MKQILFCLSAIFFVSCSSDTEITAQTTMEKIYITIGGLSENELRSFLKAGENNISVTLSLTNTTGIESPSHSSSREESIYSINGTALKHKPSKGIYIKNGKKII